MIYPERDYVIPPAAEKGGKTLPSPRTTDFDGYTHFASTKACWSHAGAFLEHSGRKRAFKRSNDRLHDARFTKRYERVRLK